MDRRLLRARTGWTGSLVVGLAAEDEVGWTTRAGDRPTEPAAPFDRAQGKTTPATATGNGHWICVSRSTFVDDTGGRVSSLPLAGGLRNQCTLTQPWAGLPDQVRHSAASPAIRDRERGTPRAAGRPAARQRTSRSGGARERRASEYLDSSSIPAAIPSSSQEPRPSASRSASQSTIIVVSWSKEIGWNRSFVASTPGGRERDRDRAASGLRTPTAAELARGQRARP